MNILIYILALGLSATLIMDFLGWVRAMIFKIPSFNYAYLGRFFFLVKNKKYVYRNITEAPVHKFEYITGWVFHYITGIFFALIYTYIDNSHTTLEAFISSILFGLSTAIIPFLVMQPILGFGFFASKTPNQWISIKNSLVAHLNFGIGLFIAQIIQSYIFSTLH
ncbi:DUF2938 family protein [Acinetobacter sp. Ver3]|uniref:DUF2938 family protein n=1 Tax=Acinetobacter sp. Ver3 TaxID=466088 RepID=UPI00044BE0A6|nr:DUF2938 family protein [Acinetobacter sp. Ver3]EZQ10540.1 membrane protein [Acinetobacter sp. Ver3]